MKNKTKNSKILLIILFVLFGLPGLFMPIFLISCIFTRQFDLSVLLGYIFFDGITLILLNEMCKIKGKDFFGTKIGNLVLMIWMFPIGLFLLWKNNKNKTTNGIVTGLVGIMLIIGFATADPQKLAENKSPEKSATDRMIPKTEKNEDNSDYSEVTTTEKNITTTTKVTTEETTTTEPITTELTTTEPTTTAEITTKPVEITEITTTEKQTIATYDVREISSDYVLNTDTLKAHTQGCRDLDKISPENKEDFYGTINDLISRGYEPCGHCRPW